MFASTAVGAAVYLKGLGITILLQKCIVPGKGQIDRIQQASQMVLNRTTPDKYITVCIGFDLSPIDKKFFQCNKAFFLQPAQKLVIKIIQYFRSQLFSFKLIKSIRASFMVNCLQAIPLAKINTSQKHTFLLSAIIPLLLLNADVWFMFIPKKIFVLIQAPFVASQFWTGSGRWDYPQESGNRNTWRLWGSGKGERSTDAGTAGKEKSLWSSGIRHAQGVFFHHFAWLVAFTNSSQIISTRLLISLFFVEEKTTLQPSIKRRVV